jgi:hypothetical protein
MLFEEQISDHLRLFLATMQVTVHGGDHLGLVGRSAFAQGIGLYILIFIGASFVEATRGNLHLTSALNEITAR